MRTVCFAIPAIFLFVSLTEAYGTDSEEQPDYDAAHDVLMSEYRELHSDYTDVVLSERWQEKARVDRASVALFDAAIEKYPASPHREMYEEILAHAKDVLEQGEVDLEQFKRNLKIGSLTQLRLSFEMYLHAHDGEFPEKLSDALTEGMKSYAVCPIHKVPYVYHRPVETVTEIRAKYWTETAEKDRHAIGDDAPVLLECPEYTGGPKLGIDLTIRWCCSGVEP